MLVVPVPFTTPDGAERNLRFSQGAKRRMNLRFGVGKSVPDILKEHGDNAILECAYFMMYDEDGKPPADLTVDRLFEQLAPQQMTELLAAVMSAMTQAETPKNELETLLKRAQDLTVQSEIQKLIVSGSGVSADSVSDSVSESSGGPQVVKSRRGSTDTAKSKSK